MLRILRYYAGIMSTATLYQESPVTDKHFEVDLPEEIVEWFGWREAEVPGRMRETLVVELLRRHVISQGKAAELLGMTQHALFDLMTQYRIPVIDLTEEELQRELDQPFPRENA
jgi:predicted HTH domain antitoxin